MNSYIEQKSKLTRGGRLTKWKGRAASLAPAFAYGVSVIALGTTGVLAQTVVDSYTTSQVELVFDEALIIESTGSVRVEDDNSGAFAVLFDGNYTEDFEGSIVNDGVIELTGDDGSGSAIAIDGASLYGTIENDGVIRVDRDSDYPASYGIKIENSVEEAGSILNTGEIDVYANSDYDSYESARAYGVYIGSDLNGVLTNDGEIGAEAEAQYEGSDARAYGVFVDDDVFGDLVNNDEINATATTWGNYAEARAVGIYVDDDLGGDSLRNNGDITASATTDGDYYADAFAVAISVDNIYDGTLTSSGELDVDAIANGYDSAAFAAGIEVDGYIDGATIDLSGEIDVRAINGRYFVRNDGAFAAGVVLGVDRNDDQFYFYNTNDIENSAITQGADIDVLAEGDFAWARGVELGDLDTSTFTNTGDIAVEATAFYDSAYGAQAYGIYISDVFDSDVTNRGNLDVDVGVAGDVDPYLEGAGIYVRSDVDGASTLTNEGDITVNARTNVDTDINVAGILIGSDIGEDYGDETIPAALVLNSGKIDVTGESTGAEGGKNPVYAQGIFVDDNIGESNTNGTLRNAEEGEIIVEARNAHGYTEAIGLGTNYDLGDDDENGVGYGYIENLGLVDVTVYAGDGNALGFGILVGEDFWLGGVTNSGELTVLSEAQSDGSYALASGIYIDDEMLGGTITASGNTIDVTARSEGFAGATGINVDGGMYGGEIANTGDTFVLADGDAEAQAAGMFVAVLGSDAVIGNSETGLLDVEAKSSNGDAFAAGISIGAIDSQLSNVYGSINNAGVIDVLTTSFDPEGQAFAAGINVDGYLYGDVINTGSIMLEAVSPFAAEAVGMNVYAVEDGGRLTNAGDITVVVNEADEYAFAAGISVDRVREGGVVTNSGSITISTGDQITGIYINTLDGGLIQTGSISVPGDAWAIDVRSGSGTAYISTSSEIDAPMNFNNDTVVLISEAGQSSYWNVDGGAEVVLEQNGGSVWFNNPEDSNEYATFSTIGNSSSTLAVADATRLAFNANLMATRSGGGGEVTQSTMGGWQNNTGGGWITGQVNKLTWDGVNSGPDEATKSRGLTLGYTGQLQNGLNFSLLAGVGGGSARSYITANSFSTSDVDSTYLGGVISKEVGGTNISFGVVAGVQNNDTQRGFVGIGGATVAKAEFDSKFVAAEFALAHRIDAGNGLSVTPGLRLRYTNVSVDSYTETGSSANATVASHSVGITDVEASIAVAKRFDFGTLSGSLGILSRSASNGATNVTLIGDTNSITGLYSDGTVGTVGINMKLPVSDMGAFHIGVDALFGGDTTKTGYSANAGFSLNF